MELNLNSDNVESCGEWVLQMLATSEQEKAVNIATVLWGTWAARNMKVWEQKLLTPDLAMQWSAKHITQWREAQKMRGSNNTGRVQDGRQRLARWRPLEEGSFKINVDASVITGLQDFSCGMVLRNHQGSFCRARVERNRGEVTAFEGEARGMLAALNWAKELNVSNVTVESDSMLLVQALSNNNTNYLEVGIMIQECRKLLEERPDFSVSYIRKQANTVAHLLARVPCMVDCFHDFSSPPQIVLENLVYDAFVN